MKICEGRGNTKGPTSYHICRKCGNTKANSAFRRGKYGGLTKTCANCLDTQAKWDEQHRNKITHPGTHWPTLVRNYELTAAEVEIIALAAKAVSRHSVPTAEQIIDGNIPDRNRRAILLGMVCDYRRQT